MIALQSFLLKEMADSLHIIFAAPIVNLAECRLGIQVRYYIIVVIAKQHGLFVFSSARANTEGYYTLYAFEIPAAKFPSKALHCKNVFRP